MTVAHTHAGAHAGPWHDKPTLAELQRQDIWSLRRGFLARLWPDVAEWRVLEVGSGPAHDSLVFAEGGADVTALDSSAEGLQLAEQFYRDLRLPLRTVLGDARRLPFADGEFDLAFNGGVLEHFADEALQDVLDEMIRVVRPGGFVLAFCPNRHNVCYQAHLRRIDRHGYEFERAFTAGEMAGRFRARGLRGVHVSGVHVHPAPNYLLPAWLPKHHRIEPLCRRCFAWLERADRWHRLKAAIGQDFVVWAEVPAGLRRRPLGRLARGPAGGGIAASGFGGE